MGRWILAVMLMLTLAVVAPAWAELAPVTSSILAEDALELDNATPGTSKTFLGTRLRGPLTQGSTTYASGDNGNPSSVTFTTPTTTVFLKTTGATTGESYRLGDGQVGQELTVILTSDGGKNFTVTPKTKTGFTDILMDDVRDGATMKFIDTTTGWIVTGNHGATIQ